MNLTYRAMRASRLTLFAAGLILLAGVATFMGFPSQEEPSVTVRDALVSVSLPGLSAERTEELLARPLEEKIRELADIRNVVTTVKPGRVIVQVTAYDSVKDLGLLWQRLRAKTGEASGVFPAGTQGPFVDDDFGRVAVASIAVTAPGFSMSEMRRPVKRLRNQLYELDGVDQVELYGLQEERIYLDFDHQTLAAAGLSPQQLMQQLQARNVIAPGGNPVIGQQSTTLSVSGEILSLEQLRQFPVQLSSGQTVALQSLGRVSVAAADPPDTEAIYQGQDAVVLAVSMQPGLNVQTFGSALRKRLGELEQQLPAGFTLHIVTFQSDVVKHEMSKMYHVMAETVVIVMCVVMLFLGWRTGLVVGVIVPLTILSTLLVMRALGIELQTVSIAAIILALGLLVDNGIVIAEDIERRLHAGEDRRSACEQAGRTLMIPLLTSSLVIVLAFSPFFLGQTSTNEYLRSLAIVLATTLVSSWLLSVTVTPLLCFYFARSPVDSKEPATDEYASVFYRGYRKVIEGLLRHYLIFIGSMAVLLVIAVTVLTHVPYDFLPKSDRMQFQIPLVLEPGSSSRATSQAVRDISQWLSNDKDVKDSIGYVADGGPRIVLGLNPPLSAPDVAYFTVSVRDGANVDEVIERTRHFLLSQHPEIEAQPKRFSLGTTEAGVAIYRVIGPDEKVLRTIARRIEQALSALPGTLDVHDDWRNRLLRYDVVVDQYKALHAGVSTQDIAQALQLRNNGLSVSSMQDGETAVAIVAREQGTPSMPASELDSTLIYPASGAAPLMLSAIATVEPKAEASTIQRRNLERAITVVGHNPSLTATSIVEQLAPQIAALNLPAGYRIELGGEIEDSAEANQALLQYMPHALVAMLLLFIWQFNSFRKLLIVISSVPFVLIGVALALVLTGYPFGFMATFGLLSLAGIIVNNAVLLLERIEAEREGGLSVRESVVNAAVKRLRPIVMTKLTCIIGLIPLMLFAGPLWEGMAITIMGGLALGTLVTLGLIPILYWLLFEKLERRRERTLTCDTGASHS
ncbi:Acriflavin resistance protein [Pseudomonas tremae]|uniref:Acriflavin resistance protein n=2 Tax=Pseudomonas syringae group TaxID=136849 RepID=A0AA40P705_9PSED|nr:MULTISPECIES: efflux RND transporter permease subunit [Pseudomonas syringae group]KPZ05560.1 Acriflavin resistance protein [Pseudomonas tremae]MCQ2990668.1 efflux RND transporter permease subunit [Pseudomonas tremae]QIQ70157.1 Multidrug resistance protein MdtC [Pseudomonas coronafaciens]RMM78620.1 Acriflavin resistance protein [Pseudomonas coronafaciens pv. striafaciens]RMO03187.1 Acriflavin resistance protein [Pseudomonas coronafaciens pv. zizaniae]